MGIAYELALGSSKLNILLGTQVHKNRLFRSCNRHSHADYELHIILSGSCIMDVEDNRYPLQQMQAILIPPGQYHLPTPVNETFGRFVVPFSPSEGSLRKQLEAKTAEIPIFSVTPEIADLCLDIFREREDTGPFWQDMLRGHLTKLMICIFRILNIEDFRQNAENSTDAAVSHLIDEYFEVHMGSSITAEDLASELHLSRRQLARILKQTYGMGFREKLIRTRMDRASWLLRSTEKSIPEIAFDVGYNSDAAFFAIFKSHFGQTPAAYREVCQNNTE